VLPKSEPSTSRTPYVDGSILTDPYAATIGRRTEKQKDEMMLFEPLYSSVLRDKRQFSWRESNR
jgi:hypothetical protein